MKFPQTVQKKSQVLLNHGKFATLLFSLALLVGILVPELFSQLLDQIVAYLKELTSGPLGYDVYWLIFSNNVRSTFLSFLLGVFVIYPMFVLLLNGYILGAVGRNTFSTEGFKVFLYILPHGVFEIPAIIFASALGLYVAHYGSKEKILQRMKRGMYLYVTVVLPLLVIAALIEGSLVLFLK